ncbi:hypothetical protein [Streptomyces stelliscabiei]|uniref:Uncharacterized protein n=1 Tax=Streptomyces stelliscabiei TaxID=146820 RepID=A0A8I0P7K7_9ACTN|nr:hypothetical protein [Streptomyces stelliscabiei]KND29885.1 hypothetical protein IQ64_41790 [Streptomyces stelliscabiei]MBE1598992.1 hypothetical protein [Streptomyces stelliscabiei]MBE1599735.1 hypothetical protein [Streptomyces stelliscabiei]MDX2519393.1 hypothetical protein [Streptomyces stelliscabiei]MDX2549678.1 hypothetical protein [Streptomyces stelliscabiei]
MTIQLPFFVDCPYGGCEDGYCACLERDLDDLDDLEVCGEYDPEDAELLEALQNGAQVITVRGRTRLVETVPIPIDNYPPQPAPDPLGAIP